MATKKAPSKKAPAKKTTAKKTTAKRLSLIEQTVANAVEKHAREGRGHLAMVNTKLSQIEGCFYEVGGALSKLREPRVWSALGFESFEALVETIPNLSLATANRLIRITEHYQEPTAIALTQTKAIALLTYVEATPEADDAESLASEDAVVGGLPISKQSARGILEAAAEVRTVPKKPKRPGEAEARAHATSFERALEPLTKEAVNVRVVHRKGTFRVLVDMPVGLLPSLSVKRKK
jgi:hypothetical protein